jgi:nitrilase
MRGGAAIIDPLGAVLAGPCFDEEQILYAELDLDDIARGKYDFDVAGHYARPDVFQLNVNEQPQRPMVYDQPSARSPGLSTTRHPRELRTQSEGGTL